MVAKALNSGSSSGELARLRNFNRGEMKQSTNFIQSNELGSFFFLELWPSALSRSKLNILGKEYTLKNNLCG